MIQWARLLVRDLALLSHEVNMTPLYAATLILCIAQPHIGLPTILVLLFINNITEKS